MVALDTNIVVRFLTKDDPEQFLKSKTIFATQEIFLADTVLLETGWVLRYAYAYEPAQISGAIRKLCGLPTVHLADAERVLLALAVVEAGLDWVDAFHLAYAESCTALLTFDQRFATRATRWGGVPVELV